MSSSSILIVEDNHAWSRILKLQIENAGYFCEIANSLEEALEMVTKENFKLAILDLNLSGGNPSDSSGLFFADWLSKNEYDTKVIFITGAIRQTVQEVIQHHQNVVDVLYKGDFELELFIGKIRNVMSTIVD